MPEKNRHQPRTIHIFTEKFTEGEWHFFRVQKILEIPGEEFYYLLESSKGNRMLMPLNFYKHYGIEPGNKIKCRIDKINCSGKIFLEPEHPNLINGRRYDFKISGKEQFTDRKGRPQTYYSSKLPDGMQVHAILDENISLRVPVHIKAKLIRTRKGILILNEIEVVNNC
jgi:hypothetical protein